MAAVLRDRQFQLLWAAQFASLVAGFFYFVAVSWVVLELTGSTLAVGSVLAAASIPMAVLMLFGGAASDRFSPRTTMVVAGLIRAGAVGALAVLAAGGAVEFWHVLVVAVIVGATTAFFVPASGAMLPRLVSGDGLQAGNALLQLGRPAAMVLGSAAAGVVVAAVGGGAALAVDAGASVLTVLLLIPLPREAQAVAPSDRGPAGNAASSAIADIREGLRYVWRDVPLRSALLIVAVLNFAAIGAIEVGLPALAHQDFAEGAVALGAAFAAWGIGSTIGAILAGTRPIPRRFGRFMLVMTVLIGAGLGAIAFATTLPILVGLMVVNGVVEGIGTTFLLSWLQGRTDPSLQGRVMAIAMLSSVGLEPAALAIAGVVAAQGLGILFVGSAVAIELVALGAGFSRSVRQIQAVPAGETRGSVPAAA